ncbi:MAG TPA: transketolase [Anaerolineales bacterium]|nr:transketolase [Anaerolineales bacterium]
MTDAALVRQAVNTLRFLAADMVEEARSGHPGLPMGAAAMAYALWMRHLRHNPRNPHWPNRDRFILSGGHGSALLYALLHLTGYDLPLEELRRFRQWGSKTPGHPEVGLTPGVETTTGPLGQGFANGVGMAIAQAHMAARFNRPGFSIFDHYIYALVTDGDLMEGISSEAASLAGHLRLGRLIYLYDDNRISIDGSTDLAFTEDRARRFEAYGWQVLHVVDGNDVDAVDAAIAEAKADPRPSLIICRTHIGYGAPHKQDTPEVHGSPLGEEELSAAKRNLGWPVEPRFYIPEAVREHFAQAVARGTAWEAEWQERFAAYRREYPDLAAELERRWAGQLPEDWDADLPVFPADAKGMATRAASGKALNALARRVPELIGGSADLTPSNKTQLKGEIDFQADTPQGRYIHFGVREHAMGAIVNGLALYGGLRPFGSTFLVFSDYMRPAIRISALSHIPSIWVFTHDSIGVGEDGPTHQPVEHLAALRAIPNLVVLRPGDANETVEAWKAALQRRDGPTALVLSRQAMPTLDRTRYAPASGLARGAYVLADLGPGEPQLILMASGSEVGLIVTAAERLAEKGVDVRVVSCPSWELFLAQDEAYRERVLPSAIWRRIAVEAGVRQGWERWVGDRGLILSVERFGVSAPGKEVMEKFDFTVDGVLALARRLLAEA